MADPWVRQKRDQQILQNTGCITWLLSRTSQNRDVEIKMAEVNAKYFKVNFI